MKVKLASLNLAISISVISAFLCYAWFVWHPYSFSALTGLKKSAGIILLANICLGPLLILIVYKQNKKHLTFDLTVLALIQISAFIFGAYSIYLKHPVYTVFTVDRFTLINPKSATPLNATDRNFNVTGFYKPKFAFAKLPTDRAIRNKIMMEVVFNGEPDYDVRAEYYEPLDQHFNEILNKSLNPNVVFANKLSKNKLAQFLNKNGGHANNYAYLPLQGGNKDVVLVLSKSEGKVIDVIDTDPWIAESLALSNSNQ